jgi:hypothetical protein
VCYSSSKHLCFPPVTGHTVGADVEGEIFECITIWDILCLPCEEAAEIASLRFIDVQAHRTEFLECTSVTCEGLQVEGESIAVIGKQTRRLEPMADTPGDVSTLPLQDPEA